MKEAIEELIKKWEQDSADTMSVAQKSLSVGNTAGYKEFMSWTFAYNQCISDLTNLLKQNQ